MNYSQNFLVDQEIISRIVGYASELRPLIEIGCGKGNLSRFLNPDVCIELDSRLLPFLSQYNPVQGDARKLPVSRGQIVSSLPYSITSDFFVEVSRLDSFPRLLLVLQEDFVNKILDYPTFLSFLLNYYYRISELMVIPPKAFRPVPKVFSSLVLLERRRNYNEIVTEIIKCLSSYRNKTLKNASQLCGLSSTETRRVRDFKPWMVTELLGSVGISSA
ncbi:MULTISPECIES: 16S ribosomal RNA methyltransferase A [Metallosphaera]|uniref:Dimethyladenosine transferase n=3 Tax=Metallosphaera TaxID=41980 RepID=A4YCT9_METS5|nr:MULTISPECIES: 16S ribosomal RNA methyltransferase A [Metallosphaera]ABP94241.1 dimethyladenosine transferase [Metallosphaera sedula DSM 5348]AIM26228.1 dimethyladenosine transferase [Metallosphaera sedula]MCY0862515.1 16S ribosomal RNA methyltransferase A [Metallosphaera prunae]QCO30164.1 16S ribosomal RNA methyltransferase A [Metallosphaera prunae]WPX06300.1 16S ribosomal RNA methyltransferase A [Metallosphaera sedula DSM 5348]